jgi:hypothetical protein
MGMDDRVAPILVLFPWRILMISSRAQAIVLAGLLTLPMVSKALVIDFQNPAIETYTLRNTPGLFVADLDVQGLRFISNSIYRVFTMETSPDGNRYLMNPNSSFNELMPFILITRDNGRFDLNSVSLFASMFHERDWHLKVEASTPAGGRETVTFNVPIASDLPTNPSYQTLDLGLHNVSTVLLTFVFTPDRSPGLFEGTSAHLYLDNFNLTLVPEPTVLGYFGLGLVSLAAVARSRGRAAKPKA